MRGKSVTVTEVVRHFSDYINRVAYGRESFLLYRGKRVVAELRPAVTRVRLGELPAILSSLPRLSADEAKNFLQDINDALKELSTAE